ncbi:MAG: NAD(P)H-dependent glycerol-3-phosphate dehydrogenase [candidate division KSB1 bacterium]|nr:NAD(P)H-dependent glycerol-3-phosphate dehydrogenase [candidate division KSB1 bacterium]
MNIAVLGAGSWGIALSLVLDYNGHRVRLWEFRPDAAERLDKTRDAKEFLPGITLPHSIQVMNDFQRASSDADLIVVAVPSHVVRSIGEKLNQIQFEKSPILINVAKGIENETLMRMSEVLQQTIQWANPSNIVTLSGPSHAEEVSRRIPTAIVSASKNMGAAELVQQVFMNEFLRVYTNADIIGVELGGSLKNIIAIAAGICDGAGFGDNTKAALQPRGLVEIVRLGVAMGADPITFAGLSGMGDLIVTCMSRHSRNRYVGEQIGKGRKLDDILKEMVMVAEGVKTTKSAYALSKKFQVEMPITEQVYHILFEGKDARVALKELMLRGPKEEKWG